MRKYPRSQVGAWNTMIWNQFLPSAVERCPDSCARRPKTLRARKTYTYILRERRRRDINNTVGDWRDDNK